MANLDESLRVWVGSSALRPRAFRWQGRTRRVLEVESVATFGSERRYRVQTLDGCFELGLFADVGEWRLRRCPGLVSRLAARWRYGPQFPVFPWRRRARCFAAGGAAATSVARAGGGYASRLALVRQQF